MSVKRYSFMPYTLHPGASVAKFESTTGEYVTHADYAALEAALKACVEALELVTHNGRVHRGSPTDSLAAAREVLK